MVAPTCPENSTLEVCNLIDEGTTGMAVGMDRLGMPLGKFLLILGIVVSVIGLFGALIVVIKRGITNTKYK